MEKRICINFNSCLFLLVTATMLSRATACFIEMCERDID